MRILKVYTRNFLVKDRAVLDIVDRSSVNDFVLDGRAGRISHMMIESLNNFCVDVPNKQRPSVEYFGLINEEDPFIELSYHRTTAQFMSVSETTIKKIGNVLPKLVDDLEKHEMGFPNPTLPWA